MTGLAEYLGPQNAAERHAAEVCDQLEALAPYGRYRAGWQRAARPEPQRTYEGAGWHVLHCRRRHRNSVADSVFVGPFKSRDEARALARGLVKRHCAIHTECQEIPLLGKACLTDQLVKLHEKGLFRARPGT